MDYLETGRRVIAEINSRVQPKLGQEIGRSNNGTLFLSLGNFYSDVLGSRLHLGFKDITADIDASYSNREPLIDLMVRRRVALEQAIISKIATNLPHRIPQLPLFYCMAVDEENMGVGIVMEDLSEGGHLEVESIDLLPGEPYPDRELVEELIRLFGCKIYPSDLGNASFQAVGRERVVLVDLDKLLDPYKKEDAIKEMEGKLDDNSIRIPRHVIES